MKNNIIAMNSDCVSIGIMAMIVVLTITTGCSINSKNSYNNDNQSIESTEPEDSVLLEKTVLTMVANSINFGSDANNSLTARRIESAVEEFNKANIKYQIQLTDYIHSYDSSDKNSNLTKLTIEINSGKIPDIIEVSGIPFYLYAEKGMFTNLYPFIDSDTEYTRDDFVQGVFDAAEVNGSLYFLFPSFGLSAIVGNPYVLGSAKGWNVDEFIKILDAYPEANLSLGVMTNIQFLKNLVEQNITKFIDWEAGRSHFDNDEFIRYLEVADRFPSDGELSDLSLDPTLYHLNLDNVIMMPATPHRARLHTLKGLFNGDLVLKGYPNEYRTGPLISLQLNLGFAITEHCEDKEAAWEFIRTFLSEEWQRTNLTWLNYPTNQIVFDEAITSIIGYEFDDSGLIDQETLVGIALTQEDVDNIVEVINTAPGITGWGVDELIWDIISDCASDYFRGIKDANDTVRDIQNRVSILVSERN